MRLIVVICKSVGQFRDYGKDVRMTAKQFKVFYDQKRFYADDAEYVCITHPEQLQGLRGFEVQRWGQWFHNPFIKEIEAAVAMRKFR